MGILDAIGNAARLASVGQANLPTGTPQPGGHDSVFSGIGAALNTQSSSQPIEDKPRTLFNDIDTSGIMSIRNSGSPDALKVLDSQPENSKLNQAPTQEQSMPYYGVPQQYKPEFDAASKATGVPSDILGRVAYTESHFRDDIISGKTVSKTGAQGMFQFMPSTSKDEGINALDPEQAIHGGANYLSKLSKSFGGDWRKAVASYNWGIGHVQNAVKQYGDKWESHLPTETINYLASVFPKQ